jgi:hypothetical protein
VLRRRRQVLNVVLTSAIVFAVAVGVWFAIYRWFWTSR